MRPIRRILVAVKDPKAKSLPAIAKAAQLARATGATLELFHAISDAVFIDALGAADRSLGEFEARSTERYVGQLEALAAPLRRRAIKVSTRADWDYPIYEAIVRRAAAIKADLIVAERHATKHVAPWLLRFTDWELLRLSAVPVLLVKSPRPYRRPVVLAAVDPTHAYAKPARLDDEILRHAEFFTEALQGKLHAMHAYVPVPIGMASAELITPNVSLQIEANVRAKAQSEFERAIKGRKIPRTRRHLVASHPSGAISMVAGRIRSSLVVMGAVSRSGLKSVFIGNTAERVLDELACDVLVVKPLRFASQVARTRRGVRLVASPLPA
jgi:universal stress protein E